MVGGFQSQADHESTETKIIPKLPNAQAPELNTLGVASLEG
jgi:hypothetical protein